MTILFTMNLNGSLRKIKGEYTPMKTCGWAPPWPSTFEVVTITPECAITDKDRMLIRFEADDVYARYLETCERFM